VITKVKHSKGQTKIRWRDVRQEETVEHEMTSSEDPRPELLDAIRAFTPFVIEICEFPADYEADTSIIGVSLNEVDMKDGNMIGIVITAQKRLEKSALPMIINTPFLVDEAWPKGLQKAVEMLEAEAVRFRSGDRAQQVIPEVKSAIDKGIQRGLEHLQKLCDKDGTTISLGVNGEEPKVIIRPRNKKQPEAHA
jgi:hypothetical protein